MQTSYRNRSSVRNRSSARSSSWLRSSTAWWQWNRPRRQPKQAAADGWQHDDSQPQLGSSQPQLGSAAQLASQLGSAAQLGFASTALLFATAAGFAAAVVVAMEHATQAVEQAAATAMAATRITTAARLATTARLAAAALLAATATAAATAAAGRRTHSRFRQCRAPRRRPASQRQNTVHRETPEITGRETHASPRPTEGERSEMEGCGKPVLRPRTSDPQGHRRDASYVVKCYRLARFASFTDRLEFA